LAQDLNLIPTVPEADVLSLAPSGRLVINLPIPPFFCYLFLLFFDKLILVINFLP